jgi:hypothetical protein
LARLRSSYPILTGLSFGWFESSNFLAYSGSKNGLKYQ